MNEVFNIDKKQKPLVDIPGYTFIGYHNIQPGIGYYIRKYDEHNNFDFVEAKIVKTGNKVKNRYVLTAGTCIKILDSFMYSYLKHRNDKLNYKDFIDLSLKEANITDKNIIEKYSDGTIPKEIKNMNEYKNILNNNYQILYVAKSPKENKLEQIYVVFVKQVKQKLMDTDINYILFKPVQLMTKMDYLKGKTKEKYSMFEYQEVTIPNNILK